MDDILSVTPLGTEELPKHINQQFKDGATFYRSKTKFGVVADGTVRVYPCDLLVLQTKSGERYIYDFVNVGTPTLAAKDALDSETLAQVNARMPTVGSGPTANSVSNSSTAGNNQTQTRPNYQRQADHCLISRRCSIRSISRRLTSTGRTSSRNRQSWTSVPNARWSWTGWRSVCFKVIRGMWNRCWEYRHVIFPTVFVMLKPKTAQCRLLQIWSLSYDWCFDSDELFGSSPCKLYNDLLLPVHCKVYINMKMTVVKNRSAWYNGGHGTECGVASDFVADG